MKFIFFTLTIFISTSAYSEDKGMPGKQLHDESCVKCHGSEVYTREDRRINSLKGLNTQVARCQNNLGISWFDDEKKNVVDFLNDSYYKFK